LSDTENKTAPDDEVEVTEHDMEMILVGSSLAISLVEMQLDTMAKHGMPDVIHDLFSQLTLIPKESMYTLAKHCGYGSHLVNDAQAMSTQLKDLIIELNKAMKEWMELQDKENLT